MLQTCLLAVALLALPGMTQAQFAYITNADNTITITNYTGTGGDVTIPDTINGVPVTSIGFFAFYGCSSLTSVTIPDSVTNIGDSAFDSCSSLTSVTIPDSVTSIGEGAFQDCSSLTIVTIGNGVTNIGDYAFYGCSSLTSVTIPDSVTSIGKYAFFADGLQTLTIGSGVASIGDKAFANCDLLASIFIAAKAPSVGLYAFSVFLSFGDSGHYFPGNATVYYLSNTTGWSNSYAGLLTVMLEGPPQFGTTADGWNYVSDQIKNTIITGYAGSNNAVVIPSLINALPVTGIASYAFIYNADTFTSVTIPNGIMSIGESAFYECYSLTNVIIGNGVASIGDKAFADCQGLTNVTFGSGVTNIGDSAFADCEGLTSVTIPDSVTSIGDNAFFSCIHLTSLTIGNSVTGIGEGAFQDCWSLTNVTIGNGVVSIGDNAFAECGELRNVTIGNGVASIGDEAFSDCISLTSIHFSGNAPTADSSVFAYVLDVGYAGSDFDPATVYYLPGTLGWSNSFAGRPTAQWFLPQPQILDQGPGFGTQSNQFGFTISWATNVPVVVEACTNLSNPVWLPVSTNTLVNGSSYFSDPQPANLPGRFYRLRSP
jgi:BspA type Leucine rich repeat region (6 copies)